MAPRAPSPALAPDAAYSPIGYFHGSIPPADAPAGQAQKSWQASLPLQSDETTSADAPERFLGRRTYNSSDPSPRPPRSAHAGAAASPDRPLSLNDAYLEYLKRLNANQAQTGSN